MPDTEQARPHGGQPNRYPLPCDGGSSVSTYRRPCLFPLNHSGVNFAKGILKAAFSLDRFSLGGFVWVLFPVIAFADMFSAFYHREETSVKPRRREDTSCSFSEKNGEFGHCFLKSIEQVCLHKFRRRED